MPSARYKRASSPIRIVELSFEGNRIKQLLEKHAYSQEECAFAIGVTARHFNRVVKGDVHLKLKPALKLALLLKTPVTQLFNVSGQVVTIRDHHSR